MTEKPMINRSTTTNAFEFVAVAALRAQQLQRGCIQRVPGNHKNTTLAQMEIVAGKVARVPATLAVLEAGLGGMIALP
jgi:DNA-directed RNA polymerase subunit K/omega